MKFKLILISLLLLTFVCGCTKSNPVTGFWTGTMMMNGKTVDISINFRTDGSTNSGSTNSGSTNSGSTNSSSTNSGSTTQDNTISSNDLMMLEIPLTNMKNNGRSVSFSYTTGDANFSFEGKVDNDKINGIVNMRDMPPDMKISFELSKKSEVPPVKSYSVEKRVIKSSGANISAEIFKPNTEKLHPAIILLHGSSGNLKNMYSGYADFFANLGFEVLIFDKRGNGESTGNNSTATYEDLANDVIACLETMFKRESVDKNKIGLWGISQGGMLLPFIASKTKIPSFLIAISAEVNGTSEAAAFADSIRIVNSGNSPENGHIAAESHRTVARMISSGSNSKEVESFIIQNAQKYSFMENTALYRNITISQEDYQGLYWSGRKYNFYPYWKNLTVNTLVLFGEDDDLVNPVRNDSIINSLKNNKIETKIFSGANHMLKKTFNPRKYPDYDWPRVKEGYLEFVKNWVERMIVG
ncbi:MAG: alpha/beta fold hydrolase [Ignavibacteria bacterium]|nr:alpha/beta fold hydrolase [Ignavibacteria bacterium]